MSSPSLTLQCRQCSGIFAAPKVDFTSLVKCPHCAIAAPIMEFAALQEDTTEVPEIGQSVSPNPPLPDAPAPAAAAAGRENEFQLRGRWLQFDCPHCLRPMRLVAEDAGGLVDCAHCGLELVAPDPPAGRGARLSRSSQRQVGSINRHHPRDLRGRQLRPPGPKDAPTIPQPDGQNEGRIGIDPNHSLARNAEPIPTKNPFQASPPGPRKRAVKALDNAQVGRSFHIQNIVAEQAAEGGRPGWERRAPRPAFGESQQDKRGFWVAAGITAAMMALVVAMVVREVGASRSVFEEARPNEAQAAQGQQRSSFEASFAAAQQALASPEWEALIPHVRQPERVAPLMRAHYAEQAYSPVEITGFHAPVEVQVGSLSLHEMKVTSSAGETRTLVMEPGPDGPKLDWELFVNLPQHEWRRFLQERPSQPQTIRAIASLCSVQDRYFTDAGLTRDEAIGLRLWLPPSQESYFAVLPNDHPLTQQIAGQLQWEAGRKITIGASFDPGSTLDDRLRIDAFAQSGWLIP